MRKWKAEKNNAAAPGRNWRVIDDAGFLICENCYVSDALTITGEQHHYAQVLDALRIGRQYVARCNEVDDCNQPNLDKIDAAIASLRPSTLELIVGENLHITTGADDETITMVSPGKSKVVADTSTDSLKLTGAMKFFSVRKYEDITVREIDAGPGSLYSYWTTKTQEELLDRMTFEQKQQADLMGRKIGSWTILKRIRRQKHLARCACGVEKEVDACVLMRRQNPSCRQCFLERMRRREGKFKKIDVKSRRVKIAKRFGLEDFDLKLSAIRIWDALATFGLPASLANLVEASQVEAPRHHLKDLVSKGLVTCCREKTKHSFRYLYQLSTDSLAILERRAHEERTCTDDLSNRSLAAQPEMEPTP